MRNDGFPESLIKKLSPYLGKKRKEAFDELDKRPLVLNDGELDFINRQVMTRYGKGRISQWDNAALAKRDLGQRVPYFHELTSNQQTIIFSRYYHQGPGWIRKNSDLFEAMQRNDWVTVARQLESKANRPGPEWLQNRYRSEQKFLEGKL